MEYIGHQVELVAHHEISHSQFLNETAISTFEFSLHSSLLVSKVEKFTLLANNYDGDGSLALPMVTKERVISFFYMIGDMINKISLEDVDLTPLGTLIIEKSNQSGDYLILDIGKSRASIAYSIQGQKNANWVDINDESEAEHIGTLIGKIA